MIAGGLRYVRLLELMETKHFSASLRTDECLCADIHSAGQFLNFSSFIGGGGKSHSDLCSSSCKVVICSKDSSDRRVAASVHCQLGTSRTTTATTNGGLNRRSTSILFCPPTTTTTTRLDGFDDQYGGVVVDPDSLPSNPDFFASLLHSSLSHWKLQGKKGIWLKLPVEHSQLVPIAVKEGFEYHHAEKGYVMLTYWIPQGPCMLPANASHQVGVGGFVVNHKNEVLVVQEKYCDPTCDGSWKIPTGFIHESEEIFTGAVREVKEETGIDTDFVEVIAFRHAQNMAFEKSDLFFICMLKPLSTDIQVDDHEIQAAKWMPLTEFVEQPLIQDDSMFKKVIDIFIARLGKQYCGLFAHQLLSRFDGRSSTLYYNVVDTDTDSTCQAR